MSLAYFLKCPSWNWRWRDDDDGQNANNLGKMQGNSCWRVRKITRRPD